MGQKGNTLSEIRNKRQIFYVLTSLFLRTYEFLLLCGSYEIERRILVFRAWEASDGGGIGRGWSMDTGM